MRRLRLGRRWSRWDRKEKCMRNGTGRGATQGSRSTGQSRWQRKGRGRKETTEAESPNRQHMQNKRQKRNAKTGKDQPGHQQDRRRQKEGEKASAGILRPSPCALGLSTTWVQEGSLCGAIWSCPSHSASSGCPPPLAQQWLPEALLSSAPSHVCGCPWGRQDISRALRNGPGPMHHPQRL